MARTIELHSIPSSPAMPVLHQCQAVQSSVTASSAKGGVGQPTANKKNMSCREQEQELQRRHQSRVAEAGQVSEEYFGLVHTPVPIEKTLRIPKARAALDEEWQKLDNKPAWDLKKVRPKAQVMAEAQAKKKKVHFGALMELCHIKHSELQAWLQRYKGRASSLEETT